jgi:hypothetical protein
VAGRVSATGNVIGGNIITAGYVSATGNVAGNYIIGNGSQLIGLPEIYTNANVAAYLSSGTVSTNILTTAAISATGNVTGGNLRFGSGTVSGTGNVIAGNLSLGTGAMFVGNIVNSNANGVGNIGTSSTYFNTVFAQATSAQYADLAEIYESDSDYAPGTVVIFGGKKEITVSTESGDERVAGVISTNPAHLMNAGSPGLPVALRGRVPVKVIGPVNKGDSLITSHVPGFAQSVGRDRSYGQSVFAKAIEDDLGNGEKLITAVIL